MELTGRIQEYRVVLLDDASVDLLVDLGDRLHLLQCHLHFLIDFSIQSQKGSVLEKARNEEEERGENDSETGELGRPPPKRYAAIDSRYSQINCS